MSVTLTSIFKKIPRVDRKFQQPLLFFFSIGMTYMSREHLFPNSIHISKENLGLFYSVFGVMFAIIGGFVLVEVLRKFSNLNDLIQNELNSIQDIRDFIIYFDNISIDLKIRLKESLLIYIESFINYEWLKMEKGEHISTDTSKELYGIMRCLDEIEIIKATDSVALTEVITEISKVTTYRTKRISLSKEKIPDNLIMLLGFMSSVIILGFILLNIQNAFSHYFIVCTTSISILSLFNIINDLDKPFSGVWSLSKSDIENLKVNLDKTIKCEKNEVDQNNEFYENVIFS